jgi:hypothetical protein
MRCQEPDEDCPREAVGVCQVMQLHLCEEHLAFSTMVQKLVNASMEGQGMGFLIPIEHRFPQDPDRNN